MTTHWVLLMIIGLLPAFLYGLIVIRLAHKVKEKHEDGYKWFCAALALLHWPMVGVCVWAAFVGMFFGGFTFPNELVGMFAFYAAVLVMGVGMLTRLGASRLRVRG